KDSKRKINPSTFLFGKIYLSPLHLDRLRGLQEVYVCISFFDLFKPVWYFKFYKYLYTVRIPIDVILIIVFQLKLCGTFDVGKSRLFNRSTLDNVRYFRLFVFVFIKQKVSETHLPRTVLHVQHFNNLFMTVTV